MIWDSRGALLNASFPPARVVKQALAAVHRPLVLEEGLPCSSPTVSPSLDVHDFILEHLEVERECVCVVLLGGG